MYTSNHLFLFPRLFAALCFAIMLISLSGCATRMLMSSEPVKQPPPETQPSRFDADLSAFSTKQHKLALEQIFLNALHTH